MRSALEPGRQGLAPRLALLALFVGCIWPQAGFAQGGRFDVYEYRVRGASLLGMRQVESAVYPYLGPDRTIDDVEQARAALEKAYRDAGYATVFVDVPEQEVVSGLVKLAVTEGSVDRLRVTGARYFRNGWIRDHVPEAEEGNVMQLAELQDQLKGFNRRSADRSVTPVLRPGRESGTVEVELKVQDQLPLHGSVELNNRNSADTTDTRLNVALSYDNLWQRDHSIGVQYQVAPEDRDESEVWVGTYFWRPKLSDKTFAFFAVDSDSDIATVGGDVNVLGKGRIYGARAILPLPQGDRLFHSLVLGADYKDFDENIGFDEAGQPDIFTPIKYINLSIAYSLNFALLDKMQGFDAAVNFGPRGIADDDPDFDNKRYKAGSNYWYLDAGYSALLPLAAGSDLFWRVAGRFSPQPLISNEQFTAGGLDDVRGYFEAEVLGDYGAHTTVEWRTPNFGPRLWEPLSNLTLFAFFDWAALRLQDPLPDQVDNIAIYSTGIGLRFSAAGLVAGLDWAWPLTDGASTGKHDDRLLLRLRYGF